MSAQTGPATKYHARTLHTDVSLKCADEVLWYSKYQLATHSPVLAATLTADPLLREVKVDNHASRTVVLALQYMDNGRIWPDPFAPLEHGTAVLLYRLARDWGVKKLREVAVQNSLYNIPYFFLQELRGEPEYTTALRAFLSRGLSEGAPGTVRELVVEHRRLRQEVLTIQRAAARGDTPLPQIASKLHRALQA